MRARHRGVGGGVVEQPLGLAHDRGGIGADQFRGPGRDPLGALGGLAHHQHRLAQRGSFLLDAAAVGQHQLGDVEQPGEIGVVERFDQRDVVEPRERGVHHRADVGVGVDRKDQRQVGARRQPPYRLGDPFEPAAEILAAVAGDPDDALAREARLDPGQPRRQPRFGGDSRGDPVQRVDHGVAGDVDGVRRDVFAEQGGGGGLGRGAVQRGDGADDLAVDLLGPRMVDVAAAQPGLDMRHRHLAIIGGERAAHRGRGVALDHHPIGLFGVHYRAQPGQQRGGQRVEALVGAHQVEIVIGHHPGEPEHAVEQRAVLRRDTDPADEPRVAPERVEQREQLDRLGAGAENGEDAAGHRQRPSRSGLTWL